MAARRERELSRPQRKAVDRAVREALDVAPEARAKLVRARLGIDVAALDEALDLLARLKSAPTAEPGEPASEESLICYCDLRRLSIEDRLRLFVQACDSVQAGHYRGVIHGDIKPENVVVREVDGAAVPTVVDFDIDRDDGDLDTRTDVYGLGMVLYELLAGVPPFEGGGVSAPRPSVRLKGIGADADVVALERGLSTPELIAVLRRELDWIPLHALRHGPEQRYATASELSADVRDYLDGRPLRAAPPSAIYRVRKYAGGHRVQASAAAIIGVTFTIALLTWGAGMRQHATAEGPPIADGAVHALETARTLHAEGRLEEADEALARAARAVVESVRNVEAMQRAIGLARLELGATLAGQARYDEAEAALLDAMSRLESSSGAEHPGVLEARKHLAALPLE